MNKEIITKFANYCEQNFDLGQENQVPFYNSLPVCIIDCIYSLWTKYFKVTVPIVDRYALKFMNGNKYRSGDKLSDFISNIESVGGCEPFAVDILKNKQKLSGRLKSEICLELAKNLLLLNIETKEDFQNFQNVKLLEIVVSSVKGVGDAALHYLFMLTGDPNRCKPDVHIHRCIFDALGYEVSNEDCQIILKGAVDILKDKYENLTVAFLDSIIWNDYQSKK